MLFTESLLRISLACIASSRKMCYDNQAKQKEAFAMNPNNDHKEQKDPKKKPKSNLLVTILITVAVILLISSSLFVCAV